MFKQQKHRKFSTFFQKRRCLALEEQKNNRQLIFLKARNLFSNLSHDQNDDDNDNISQSTEILPQTAEEVIAEVMDEESKILKKKKNNKFSIAKSFQVYDWLNTIPYDFHLFYLTAKPQAQQCLLFFKGNIVLVRNNQGKVCQQFKLNDKNYNESIIEAFYSPQSKTIFLNDLICLKGNILTAIPFSERYYYLKEMLFQNISSIYTLKVLEYRLNTLENLGYFYEGNLQYPKDGLIFVHPNSFYKSGHNPNVLIWKQLHNKCPLKYQPNLTKTICKLKKDGSIQTLQGIVITKLQRNLIPKDIRFINFAFQTINFQQSNNKIVVANIENIQLLGLKKRYPPYIDPLSKILFEHRLSTNPLTINHMVQSLNTIRT